MDPSAHDWPPHARELRHLAHREGPVPVGGGEVLGHLGVHPEVLHQSDEHGGRPGVRALQQQPVRPRLALGVKSHTTSRSLNS